MNTRQQLYKKYRLEGYSKYTSARKAGYSHSYATQAKNIEKHINMEYWLEKEGLTDTYLSNHAKQGLNATKVVGYLNNKTQGVEKVSDEFVEVPDWQVRHKYYETILKLMEKIKERPLIDQSKHTHYNFEYKTVDENRIRSSQIANAGMDVSGPVEGLDSREKVRQDTISGSRTDEKGSQEA